jgi:SAM-dependent methyltransferase
MPLDHWKLLARQWNDLGPPLRPSAADVAVIQDLVDRELAPSSSRTRAAILGVTPELATLRWPPSARVTAIDRALGMFRSVWPAAEVAPTARVLNAQWLQLPLRKASFDLICGDGCNPSLRFPTELQKWLGEIHRALRPGGLLALRLFLRPDLHAPAESLVAAAMRGEIASFHGFKIRLAMSLQRDPAAGVRLSDVWETWRRLVPDPGLLERAAGWSAETIGTIENYRDATASYAFPSLDEWRRLVPGRLEEIACVIPSYEEGASFPTLVYRALS